MAAQPKQKPLLPVLKEKKRYFAYRVHAQRRLPARTGSLLVEELRGLLGVFGAAEAGLLSIGFDPERATGVLRTSNASAARVRQAMLLIQGLGDQQVMIQPIRASGVLRKARQAM